MDVVDKNTRIKEVSRFVKESLSGNDGGHDWQHIMRVVNNSLYILKYEKGSCYETVVLGALLHEVGDRKFPDGSKKDEIKPLLESLDTDQEVIEKVIEINSNISFSESDRVLKKSAELMIVQDADRLDAIGAIGIARAFSYGGFRNRLIYDPDYSQLKPGDIDAYRSSCSPTINHFYEKLLLLKDMMNTATGKKLAEERHHFMELFLAEFYKEWQIE